MGPNDQLSQPCKGQWKKKKRGGRLVSGFLCYTHVCVCVCIHTIYGLPQWLSGKESTCNAGDTEDAGLIPGSGRSPGGGHSNPVQYSCLENPIDRGAWRTTIHGVAKSWLQLKGLSTHTHTLYIYIYIYIYIYTHMYI